MSSLKTAAAQFETENDDVAVAAPTATAVVQAAKTAVGAPAAKVVTAFQEFNGVLDIAAVEAMSLAVPRIKAEQGSLFKGTDDLGSKIKFKLMSYNPRWVIGTGEDDAESKEFFRISYDNVTTTKGELVEDYLNMLKARGFTKAHNNPYMDVFGFVMWSEKGGDTDMSSPELVCLQASKTSMGNFQSFCVTQGFLRAAGMAKETDIIEVRAEKKTFGTNKFTNMSWHVAK